VQWGMTIGGQAVVGRWAGIPWKDIDFSMKFPMGAGLVILGLWLVLWLGRIGRPEKSWIDRSGRVFGAFMILVYLTGTLIVGWLNASTPRFVLPTFHPLFPAPSLDIPADSPPDYDIPPPTVPSGSMPSLIPPSGSLPIDTRPPLSPAFPD
jgi:hypothetical protein